ncbi:hypothetical protein TMatcc_008681, partial [Talaromyces marneffei ATCC 18224]
LREWGKRRPVTFLPFGQASPNSLFCSTADLAEKTSSLSFPATLSIPSPFDPRPAAFLRHTRSHLGGSPPATCHFFNAHTPSIYAANCWKHSRLFGIFAGGLEDHIDTTIPIYLRSLWPFCAALPSNSSTASVSSPLALDPNSAVLSPEK